MKRLYLLLAAVYLVSCGKIVPVDLRCESMAEPPCVESGRPQLSWVNQPLNRRVSGQKQTAYRIVVSSSEEALRRGDYDLWDSGEVQLDANFGISYSGVKLQDAQDCWWKVAVRDREGRLSRWSRPAHWTMGISSDWGAEWIAAPWLHGAAPLFEKSLSLDRKPVTARLYVSARGWYEVSINGERVGEDYLSPALTNADYRPDLKTRYIAIDDNFSAYRQLYLSYDVTDLLIRGTNDIAALVGEGYYNAICPHRADFCAPFGRNAFICRLEMKFKDGSTRSIVTDGSWTVQPSAIVSNGIFTGECYDAMWQRNEHLQAVEILPALPGSMTAQDSPADRIVENIKPASIKELEDGSLELDFGREITGWIKMEGINGTPGDTLCIRFICESPVGTEQHVIGTAKNASYSPRFTWFVFRKAIVTTRDKSILQSISYSADFVRSDVEQTSSFEASESLLERIQQAWILTQSDNMHCGVASDCPHRERIPYNGDGQVACITVLHNFDAAAFYRKWMRDVRDSQNPATGFVPNSSPWQPAAGGGVPWGASINIIPWDCYVENGDRRILEENYPAMAAHVKWMTQWITERGTMLCRDKTLLSPQADKWLNLGEWAPSAGLPQPELVHSFYLWRCALYSSKAARVLGLDADACLFEDIANSVKDAVNNHLYDSLTHSYGDYGSNVFALVMGVPDDRYEDVVRSLRDEIVDRNACHLNTGIYGTRFLFETLCDVGLEDVAYKAFTQKDYPSYGFWLEQGSTTTWEFWYDREGYSHNHPMFGGGIVWMYSRLAGVRADEEQPGYKHFIVDPVYVDGLSRVYYSNMTRYGRIACEVLNEGPEASLNVTVPVGCTASVRVPGTEEYVLLEQGKHRVCGR